MKPNDVKDAQVIINKIEEGEVTTRDLVALLMYLREHIPDDMVKDIAHCVAHNNRNRGMAHTYIEKFVAQRAHCEDLVKHLRLRGTGRTTRAWQAKS